MNKVSFITSLILVALIMGFIVTTVKAHNTSTEIQSPIVTTLRG